MDAVAKTPGGPRERGMDARFVKDYRCAYRTAWGVALDDAPLQGGARDEKATRDWAHKFAHKVALDYAEARRFGFARPPVLQRGGKPVAPSPRIAGPQVPALQGIAPKAGVHKARARQAGALAPRRGVQAPPGPTGPQAPPSGRDQS